MAVLLNYNRPNGNPDYVVPAGIALLFSTNLGESQINSGVAAKVTIIHPAFQTRATVFKNRKGQGYHVMASSIDIGTDSKNYFNIVELDQDFRNYIVDEFKKFLAGNTDQTPWYQKMIGEHVSTVTSEPVSESLGIVDTILGVELSEGQQNSGMVAKVTIKTNVGSLRGFSVYRSRYGQSLYGIPQNEDDENNIPAYRLSREAEAQVLSFIHSLVQDWGEAPAPRQREVGTRLPSGEGTGQLADIPPAGGTATEQPPVAGATVTSESSMYNDN